MFKQKLVYRVIAYFAKCIFPNKYFAFEKSESVELAPC